jgi:hypothetical protein
VKEGKTTQYKFYNYTSGFIHRVTLDSLQGIWAKAMTLLPPWHTTCKALAIVYNI